MIWEPASWVLFSSRAVLAAVSLSKMTVASFVLSELGVTLISVILPL